jgi:hypothetical protein
MAKVYYENNQFYMKDPKCLQPFEGWSERWEKNWVPFVYDGKLLFAYSIVPHRILQPVADGACTTISNTRSQIKWFWGQLRGGTPALLDGNEYLAFFHSSKKIATTHSNGKPMPHYVMGAYTFAARPPFEITRISAEPIVGQHFYEGPAYNTWKPLRVVFPGGYLVDDKYVWIVYGRQDFELWVAQLDKKGLYDSLVTCPKIMGKDEQEEASLMFSPNVEADAECTNSQEYLRSHS